MTLDEAQYAYLSTYGDLVTGLVALIGTRLYPDKLPQEAILPAMTYQQVSEPRLSVHTGPVPGGKVRMQYTVFALTRAGAKAVAAQLVGALNGYRGMMGAVGGTGGLLVTVLEIPNEIDQHDPETDSYQTMVDAILAY